MLSAAAAGTKMIASIAVQSAVGFATGAVPVVFFVGGVALTGYAIKKILKK
jgi:hypothetical protein